MNEASENVAFEAAVIVAVQSRGGHVPGKFRPSFDDPGFIRGGDVGPPGPLVATGRSRSPRSRQSDFVTVIRPPTLVDVALNAALLMKYWDLFNDAAEALRWPKRALAYLDQLSEDRYPRLSTNHRTLPGLFEDPYGKHKGKIRTALLPLLWDRFAELLSGYGSVEELLVRLATAVFPRNEMVELIRARPAGPTRYMPSPKKLPPPTVLVETAFAAASIYENQDEALLAAATLLRFWGHDCEELWLRRAPPPSIHDRSEEKLFDGLRCMMKDLELDRLRLPLQASLSKLRAVDFAGTAIVPAVRADYVATPDGRTLPPKARWRPASERSEPTLDWLKSMAEEPDVKSLAELIIQNRERNGGSERSRRGKSLRRAPRRHGGEGLESRPLFALPLSVAVHPSASV